MNFRPASLKVNNVHIGFHQLDAAAMLGKGIRQRAVACCFFEVESISLVRHDDGYFPARPAAAANVHFCVGVLVTAVHDGIPQSLAEGQFDTELFSRSTLRTLNQEHQAFHQRGDSLNFTWHPAVNFQDERRNGIFSWESR
jgi:hypothetical protein